MQYIATTKTGADGPAEDVSGTNGGAGEGNGWNEEGEHQTVQELPGTHGRQSSTASQFIFGQDPCKLCFSFLFGNFSHSFNICFFLTKSHSDISSGTGLSTDLRYRRHVVLPPYIYKPTDIRWVMWLISPVPPPTLHQDLFSGTKFKLGRPGN